MAANRARGRGRSSANYMRVKEERRHLAAEIKSNPYWIEHLPYSSLLTGRIRAFTDKDGLLTMSGHERKNLPQMKEILDADNSEMFHRPAYGVSEKAATLLVTVEAVRDHLTDSGSKLIDGDVISPLLTPLLELVPVLETLKLNEPGVSSDVREISAAVHKLVDFATGVNTDRHLQNVALACKYLGLNLYHMGVACEELGVTLGDPGNYREKLKNIDRQDPSIQKWPLSLKDDATRLRHFVARSIQRRAAMDREIDAKRNKNRKTTGSFSLRLGTQPVDDESAADDGIDPEVDQELDADDDALDLSDIDAAPQDRPRQTPSSRKTSAVPPPPPKLLAKPATSKNVATPQGKKPTEKEKSVEDDAGSKVAPTPTSEETDPVKLLQTLIAKMNKQEARLERLEGAPPEPARPSTARINIKQELDAQAASLAESNTTAVDEADTEDEKPSKSDKKAKKNAAVDEAETEDEKPSKTDKKAKKNAALPAGSNPAADDEAETDNKKPKQSDKKAKMNSIPTTEKAKKPLIPQDETVSDETQSGKKKRSRMNDDEELASSLQDEEKPRKKNKDAAPDADITQPRAKLKKKKDDAADEEPLTQKEKQKKDKKKVKEE